MKSIFKLLDIIVSRVAYPFLYSLLGIQSLLRRLESIGKKPKVFWENTYDGEPIALVALYQKGKLRSDTENLLKSLQSHGCYVLVVNTLKFDDLDEVRSFSDCYIEKFNFGRDFGSYKCGFEHLYSKKWSARCPRLIMINDSVFCISDRIDTFISEMLRSDFEVLGSTENYEIVHHLGSFCISFSGNILSNSKFRDFWNRYTNSDVRPRVIHNGEQQLSKSLKKIVSAPSEFRTLYGTNQFLRRLQQSDEFINDAMANARQSKLTGWRRFSARGVVRNVRKNLIRSKKLQTEVGVHIDGNILDSRIPALDLGGITRILESDLRPGEEIDPSIVRKEVVGHLTEVYMSGSQIHQNAATLVLMGLPIVKLDGLYRGMFTIQDVQMVTEKLPGEEAAELQRLLLERPYGGDALRGWKRAAFMRGLI